MASNRNTKGVATPFVFSCTQVMLHFLRDRFAHRPGAGKIPAALRSGGGSRSGRATSMPIFKSTILDLPHFDFLAELLLFGSKVTLPVLGACS